MLVPAYPKVLIIFSICSIRYDVDYKLGHASMIMEQGHSDSVMMMFFFDSFMIRGSKTCSPLTL